MAPRKQELGKGKKMKKGNRKGTPTPKTAPGARKTAPQRIEKPFCLELGKTYANKNGKLRVKIIKDSGVFIYPMVGKHLPESTITAFTPIWMRDGRYLASTRTPKDLVREIPEPKAPGARRAKGSKPSLLGTNNDAFVRGKKR